MMVEVTQEDREAAASVAVLAEMRELILSGRADHHAEPWAIHRQRGKLEGARLAVGEIVTWLEEMYENCESIDGMLTRMDSKDELANMMQAKFGGRDAD